MLTSVAEFTVETHYDFINTKDHKSSSYFESRFKQLACEGKSALMLRWRISIILCANLNALFLLKHMALHFLFDRDNPSTIVRLVVVC